MRSLFEPLRSGLAHATHANPPEATPRPTIAVPATILVVRGRPRLTREEVDAAAEHNRRFVALLPYRPWLQRVHVTLEPNACLACRSQPSTLALDELIDDRPALPHRRCTRQHGCGCWYSTPEVAETQRPD